MKKKELQDQCETALGICEGDLNGEKIGDILNEVEQSTAATIYWGCIPPEILNDTF